MGKKIKELKDKYATTEQEADNLMKKYVEGEITYRPDFIRYIEFVGEKKGIAEYDLKGGRIFKYFCEVCDSRLIRDLTNVYKGLKCCDSCFSILIRAEEKDKKESKIEEGCSDRFIDF